MPPITSARGIARGGVESLATPLMTRARLANRKAFSVRALIWGTNPLSPGLLSSRILGRPRLHVSAGPGRISAGPAASFFVLWWSRDGQTLTCSTAVVALTRDASGMTKKKGGVQKGERERCRGEGWSSCSSVRMWKIRGLEGVGHLGKKG